MRAKCLAEILIEDKSAKLIRSRETLKDLFCP
jgi:hypothetical protein